ncbi:cupincin-like [Canna indica]|uniref:Cupincin-like n=1 Tax=Canna indica TaxID=4628 RepID=A0AAQ3K1T7_9LILI|nr:cupincin-like [Canna indica]
MVKLLLPLLLLLLLVLLSSWTLFASASHHEKKRHCHSECKAHIPEGRQLKECIRRCLDHSNEREAAEREQRRRQGGGRRREHNPYYFGRRHYEQWAKTEHGRLEVLPSFAKRSELLLGVANHRLALLEAAPETFVMPSHWDAEQVIYVMEGHGIITMLHGENRESHNIRRGDLMRIPAGAIVYAINRARNEKLRIAMLLRPISTPGQIEEYFGAAGRHPQTFYTSFSNEVLEAAFNTPRHKLERLFEHQKRGQIIKINEEQVRAFSQSASHGSAGWPFAQSNEPYNLLSEKPPSHSNPHGELYEAGADDCEQLQDLNMGVSFANISQGSMMVPYYNSFSTEIVLVMQGKGYWEMASPQRKGEDEVRDDESEGQHHGREKEREPEAAQQPTRFETMRSHVSRGSAFVIPAGMPAAVVAAPNENLQVLRFVVRAGRNARYYLAGRNNVLSRMDDVAKQLAFDAPSAEEVHEVLDAQPHSVFVAGPKRREDGERRGKPSLESLFSFLGF